MARPQAVSQDQISSWLSAHPGWERVTTESKTSALARTFRFVDFASALGFVVRVGCAAEKRDHHPDVELGWGRARLLWTTHDAGGVTELDFALAEASDSFASASGEKTS